MDQKDLPITEIDRLRSFLAKRGGIALAIVCGSVAAGTAGYESDLDLALDLGRELPAVDRMELISGLAELTGRPVDLVDLSTVGVPGRNGRDRVAKAFVDMRRKCRATNTVGISLPVLMILMRRISSASTSQAPFS